MMRISSPGVSKGGVWKGILLMCLLLIISVLNVNIAGRTIGFVFLPLIGVCLWPRTDKAVLSIITIFIFGLFLDLLSAGPLGLWPLIFLTVFAVLRPHMRLKAHSFNSALTQWVVALLFALIASYLLGWFARESRPDTTALLFQALAAAALFPLIYGLRHVGRYVFSDADARGL